MAIFRIQVHYQFGTIGKWSNVYHCNTSDIANANLQFEINAVPALLALLHPACQMNRLLVSDPAGSAFIVTPINEAGTSATTDSLLPLFNSAKVIFPVSGFGRPDLKYIKGFLTETLVDTGDLTPATVTGLDNQFTAIIGLMDDDSAPLCSSTGELYNNVTVQVPVQMRQMHRKRRKTVAPAP